MGLGTKLAIFGRRLKSASLRRMGRNIQAIHVILIRQCISFTHTFFLKNGTFNIMGHKSAQ